MSEHKAPFFSEAIIQREGCVRGYGKVIPFGIQNGQLVGVGQATGGSPRPKCTACDEDLVIVKPEVRRHHFRHLRGHDCDAGLETGLHMLAKEILAANRTLLLPTVTARHGLRYDGCVKKAIELRYLTSRTEATVPDSGRGLVRPDIIVEGELGGKTFRLHVEIFVRHRVDATKLAKLRQEGLAAIEIDLSHLPPDETREFYEQQILKDAERYWLYNRFAEDARLRMRAEAEADYGHIADKITAADAEAQDARSNPWIEAVKEADLGALIGLNTEGHGCFAVTPEVWQAAILYRYVLAGRPTFLLDDAMRWIAGASLLKDAFVPLACDDDPGRLAHLRDCFPGFRFPSDVISDYAGELVRRGKLHKRRGKLGWVVPSEVIDEVKARQRDVGHWRLRLGDLRYQFQLIKVKAVNGARMEWEPWCREPLDAHGRTSPEELISAPDSLFVPFLRHLQALVAMLEPGGAVPPGGLLGLPLEPELEARCAERGAAEDNWFREAEIRRSARERQQAEQRAHELEAIRHADAVQQTALGAGISDQRHRSAHVPRKKTGKIRRGMDFIWRLLGGGRRPNDHTKVT